MKLRIFTDGACSGNPGPGGWCAIINSDTRCEKISGNDLDATNNKMELMAVCKALEKVCNLMLYRNIESVQIYSDSAYVMNAITKGWAEKWSSNNWQTKDGEQIKNKETWESLVKLLHGIKFVEDIPIEFIKVKGHSGETFNEMADEIAKQEVIEAKKAGAKK